MVILRSRVIYSLALSLIGFLWGCTTVTPAPALSSLSSPLFTPTAEDAKRVATLAHDLDNQALHCLEGSTCEEVHFARALVSLFENQEAASASFRRAIDDNPSSALSASSKLWLQLLEDNGTDASPSDLSNGPQQIILQLMAQLVRDWMRRELADHTKQTQASQLTTLQNTKADSSGVVLVLQRQVRERDRHIATLEAKLEALKVIDQDHEKRKRIIKVPATIP